MTYEWLALSAAFLWALASLLSVKPALHLGTFAYSRWRMGLTSLTLSAVVFISGQWTTLDTNAILILAVSGLIGIFVGDTALFACLNRMGPRQAGLLFSCHAVFSTFMGYFLFQETLSLVEIGASSLVFLGVITAIFFGRPKHSDDNLEKLKGNIAVGISLGVIAALCQAVGSLLAKPIMQTSVDPITGSAVRVITAFIAHSILFLSGAKIARATKKINLNIFMVTFLNGFLAMTLGMTLILFAIQGGNVGMVALLSSTTPIMLLPLLWFYTGQRPSRFAWIGALLAVIGTGFLVQ